MEFITVIIVWTHLGKTWIVFINPPVIIVNPQSLQFVNWDNIMEDDYAFIWICMLILSVRETSFMATLWTRPNSKLRLSFSPNYYQSIVQSSTILTAVSVNIIWMPRIKTKILAKRGAEGLSSILTFSCRLLILSNVGILQVVVSMKLFQYKMLIENLSNNVIIQ